VKSYVNSLKNGDYQKKKRKSFPVSENIPKFARFLIRGVSLGGFSEKDWRHRTTKDRTKKKD